MIDRRFGEIAPAVDAAVGRATESVATQVLTAARAEISTAVAAANAGLRAELSADVDRRFSTINSSVDARIAAAFDGLPGRVRDELDVRFPRELGPLTTRLQAAEEVGTGLAGRVDSLSLAQQASADRVETGLRDEGLARAQLRVEFIGRVDAFESNIDPKLAEHAATLREGLRTDLQADVAAGRRDLEASLAAVAREAAATEVRVLSTRLESEVRVAVRQELDVTRVELERAIDARVVGQREPHRRARQRRGPPGDGQRPGPRPPGVRVLPAGARSRRRRAPRLPTADRPDHRRTADRRHRPSTSRPRRLSAVLAELEQRLSDVLGARLDAPFTGRTAVAGDADPPGNGPVVRVRTRRVRPRDPDVGAVRPERAPGATDPRRVVRLECELSLDVTPGAGRRAAPGRGRPRPAAVPRRRSRLPQRLGPGRSAGPRVPARVAAHPSTRTAAVEADGRRAPTAAPSWCSSRPDGSGRRARRGGAGEPIEHALVRQVLLPLRLSQVSASLPVSDPRVLSLTVGRHDGLDVARRADHGRPVRRAGVPARRTRRPSRCRHAQRRHGRAGRRACRRGRRRHRRRHVHATGRTGRGPPRRGRAHGRHRTATSGSAPSSPASLSRSSDEPGLIVTWRGRRRAAR